MKIGYLMQAGVPDIRKEPLSGPANHVVQVIRELKALGHEVHLLAQFGSRILFTDDLKQYQSITIREIDSGPFRLFERILRRIQFELKLPYLAFFESLRFALACRQKLNDCDLFYERMGWMGFGGCIAANYLSHPLILEVNGDHLIEFMKLGIPISRSQRWLSVALTKKCLQFSDHMVAAGEGWRERIIEMYNIPPEKVSIVENGSQYVDLIPRTNLRSFSDNGEIQNPITVIYMGAMEPWHGIQILVRAIAMARKCNINLRLILVGDGSETGEINKLVDHLNLRDLVIFTGFLSIKEAARYLASADIGVSPYCGRAEYSGLKLIDYKAAGLAIVASGADGKPVIINHGKTGWIVPPCDEQALCEALITLALNHSLRKNIGKEARIEAERYHSWGHTAKNLEKVFCKVLNAV